MKIGNMDVFGVIYKITNKVNNKCYFGQTIRKNGFNGRYCASGKGIERVYNYYKNQIKYGENYNVHLFKSIEKYGYDSFYINETFDVAFSQEELNLKEECWIKIYDSTNSKKGYNIKQGGMNSKHNKESKTRIGRNIVCIDDMKEFISLEEAVRYYDVSTSWIKKTFKMKHSYNNFKNESPIFRKMKRAFTKNEGRCCICACYIKKNSSNQKYCKKCAEQVNKNRKNKNIDNSKIYTKKTYDKSNPSSSKYSKYNKRVKSFILKCNDSDDDIDMIIKKVKSQHKISITYNYIEWLLLQQNIIT